MPSLFDLPFEDAAAPEPLPREPAVSQRRILTVSELALAIRNRLEQEFFEVWVEGEISNAKIWNTGHLYFTLKDGSAQLKGVMFRSTLRYLRFRPEDGQRVIARGRVTVYEQRGECQLVCEHLEPRGLGALQQAFEQLKKKLAAEGLFAADRKRPLPLLPRRIGIATSVDGAAIRDVVKVLTVRHVNVRLLIRPCRVQGEGAASEIARAIRQLSQHRGVDVVIVGRGGGSLEDLWAFNEEVVARAIAASRVPVISAVGHEVDYTIADFVADVRAATPSNAAEIVVARADELRRRVDLLEHKLKAAARQRLAARRALVHQLTTRRGLASLQMRVGLRARFAAELMHKLRVEADATLGSLRRRLVSLRGRLEAADQRRRLAWLQARLTRAEAELRRHAHTHASRAARRLSTVAGRLENLSPLAVLARGYAVCWSADGQTILRDARHVATGDRVSVRLHRGSLDCEVRAPMPEPAEPDGAA
jgi:exodeoxyribonuclease VII large subunit